MHLRDGDLTLRPWRPDDAAAVYRAAQDPLIPRFTSLPTVYQMSHAEKFVGVVSPAGWKSGTSANFAALDTATGALLGSCGLVWIRNGLAELGYWTAAPARRRGVALRASRLVCRYAFEQRAIERISWQAEIGNHASRLVALRAGFHIDGTWQLPQRKQGGLPDGWVGTLLPGQLTDETAPRYAAGSLVARRAAVLSARPPTLPLPGGLGHLREPGDRDVDALTTAGRDPQAVRFTSVPDPYSRGDAQDFLRRRAARGWALGTAATFTVADPSDACVGTVDLRLSEPGSRTAEVGFLVTPAARGRGYATAALRTLALWGFDSFGLHRIRWRAAVGNEASRRVAQNAGFRPEGVQRGGLTDRDDRPADAWVAALLATDPR
jgi:RimJ/RimL family protein N-acetyltransferase